MALPGTDFPAWSATTNYISGPDVGTPTKVLPSAGEIAEGFVPETAAVPQHVNYLFANIKQHITYLRNLAAEAFTWTAAHTFSNTVTHSSTTNLAGAVLSGATNVTFAAPRARAYMVPLSAFMNEAGASWATVTALNSPYKSTNIDGDTLTAEWTPPRGATITQIRVFCGGGVGRTMDMTAFRNRADVVTPGGSLASAIGVLDTLPAGTSDALTTGVVSVSTNDQDTIVISVVAGGGVVTDANVYWARVDVTLSDASL